MSTQFWMDVLGGFLSTALSSLAIYWLHEKFPNQQKPTFAMSIEELKKKYRWTMYYIWTYLIFFWMLCAYLFQEGIIRIAVIQYAKLPKDAYNILPDAMAYLLPAIFFALPLALILTRWVIKQQMGLDYYEFIAYGNYIDNINSSAFARFVTIASVVIGFIAYHIVGDFYYSFAQTEIQYNLYWGIGTKHYLYSDVAKIRHVAKTKAANGDVHARSHYYIEFKDGNNWSSDYNGFTNLGEHDTVFTKLIMDRVATKTQLSFKEVEFDEQ